MGFLFCTFITMFFKSFLDYLKFEKKYAIPTQNAYIKDLQEFSDFLEDEFESPNTIQVDYNSIRSWIVHLSQSGLSNRSINRKIASLKAYYNFHLKVGTIEQSPLQKHRALKTEKETGNANEPVRNGKIA